MRARSYKHGAMILLVTLFIQSVFASSQALRCVRAYESNPLTYREPTRFAKGRVLTPFDPAGFRAIEEDGPVLKSILLLENARRPEASRGTMLSLTMPGRRHPEHAERLRRLNNFRAATEVVTEVQRHRAELDREFISDVVMDTTAKAARFLRDVGVSIQVHYDPASGDVFLSATDAGDHKINQLARELSSKKLPLLLAYRPAVRIYYGWTATLDPSNIFYVADESMLRQSLKDRLVLHELRHWKNKSSRQERNDYALFGDSAAVEGDLPGPRDNYRRFTSHDEPHAYFESLKISLLEVATDIRAGREADVERLVDAARMGYRASYRVEALARLLLRNDPAKATISIDSENRVFATMTFYWGHNLIRSRIPLSRVKPHYSNADVQAEFRQQLEWMEVSARETKKQFDRAHLALQALKEKPTLELIRGVQRQLVPVNYTVRQEP